MSHLVSSDDDDLLDFSTPSSEGLETLSSEEGDASSSNNSHIIKPLGTFAAAGIPKPSPRSHSPDKSFSHNGGTTVTSNILSVLSSYRKVPGGRGRGGGVLSGTFKSGMLSGTLPRSPRSHTNEYEGGGGDYNSPEGSMEHSMLSNSNNAISPTSTKVIHGYMGGSNLLAPQHSNTFGALEHSGRDGGADELRTPIENALFMHKGGVGGSSHHFPPQQHQTRSFSPTRIKSEGNNSSSDSHSRDDSRETSKSAPVGGSNSTRNHHARLRHLASTVKQSVSSISALGGSMSPLQQKQMDDLAKKRQQEDDIRKAKLLQFLGGGSTKGKGVLGD